MNEMVTDTFNTLQKLIKGMDSKEQSTFVNGMYKLDGFDNEFVPKEKFYQVPHNEQIVSFHTGSTYGLENVNG